MASNFLMSPGVLVKEQDNSTYVVTAAATKLSIVGYASKGEIDKPTLCISSQDFIDKFGKPPADNPYAALAALKYFEQGNDLLFVRVGYTLRDVQDLGKPTVYVPGHKGYDSALAKAAVEVDIPAQPASLPVVIGTREFTRGLQYTTSVDFELKYVNNRLNQEKTFQISGPIGGSGVTDAASVAAELNNLLDSDAANYFLFSTSGDYLVLTMKNEAEYKDSQVFIQISGTGGETTITQLGFAEGNRTAAGVGDGSGSGIAATGFKLEAKSPGTWGNDIALRFYSDVESIFDISANSFKISKNYKLTVYYDGQEVETYENLVYDDESSSNYIESVLDGSKYISFADWGTSTTPNPTSKNAPVDIEDDPAQYLVLENGANGIPTSELDFDSDDMEALNNSAFTQLDRGILTLSNSEQYEFDIVIAPGQSDSVVINSLLNLVNNRRDAIAIIDPPFGLNHEDVVAWHNGQGHGNTAAFNTSYAALYWPWLHDYDSYNKEYAWLPPSGYVARQYVYTDVTADPWAAPAGMERGKITALDVEMSASRSQRDLLYGGTNAVNPIVNFVGEGLTIWGQKTLLRENKATNRVNVRRLLIFAERLIAKMAKTFIFNPTDPTSWADFTRKANTILEPIRRRRGLYAYKVVMDETTNPPEIRDQNIMAGKIFLQPTKTAEFIYVTFTITNTGETFISE